LIHDNINHSIIKHRIYGTQEPKTNIENNTITRKGYKGNIRGLQ